MMLFLLLKNKASFVMPCQVLLMLSCLFLCGIIRIRKRYENSLIVLFFLVIAVIHGEH